MGFSYFSYDSTQDDDDRDHQDLNKVSSSSLSNNNNNNNNIQGGYVRDILGVDFLNLNSVVVSLNKEASVKNSSMNMIYYDHDVRDHDGKKISFENNMDVDGNDDHDSHGVKEESVKNLSMDNYHGGKKVSFENNMNHGNDHYGKLNKKQRKALIDKLKKICENYKTTTSITKEESHTDRDEKEDFLKNCATTEEFAENFLACMRSYKPRIKDTQ